MNQRIEDIGKIFEDVGVLLKEKFKDKKNRVIAGAVAAVIALSGIVGLVSFGKRKDDKIYFRYLENGKSVCDIYDADGNKIDTVNDVYSVATFDDKLNDSEFVAVITEDGKIRLGYVDGDIIDEKHTQVVDDVDASAFTNVSIVSARNGVYLRQNKIVDRHTDDAILLPHGSYLLGHCETETSADNAYNWRKVIYFDGKDMQFGYIADEFLLDIDLSKFDGDIFEVSTGGIPLKLRTEPFVENTEGNSNVIEQLSDGSKVYLIPNVNSSYYDEEKQTEWLYVAYQSPDGKIKFGWCAKSVSINDQRYSYLHQVIKPEIEEEEEVTTEVNTDDNGSKNKYMIVDTSKVDYVDLKLRKKPDLDSDIVIRLENGTSLVVNAEDWENQIEEDNYSWVKVTTTSGKTGYVASEYLKDKIAVDGYDSYKCDVVDLESLGDFEGYIGLDCTPDAMTPGHLEKILKGDEPLCSSRGSNTSKPNFVVIKIGATGYGTHVPDQKIVNKQLYKDSFALARLCEQYEVPYTFYFFCSALPKEDDGVTIESFEVDNENDYIVNAIREYVANNDSEYYMRSIYMDIEQESDRLVAYHKPDQLTRMYNQQFHEIDDRLSDLYDGEGINVSLYTDHNAVGYHLGSSPIFNISDIDEEFMDGLWVVNPSNKHSKSWDRHPEIEPVVHQIRLDCPKHQADANVMGKEYFESILERIGVKNKASGNGRGRIFN